MTAEPYRAEPNLTLADELDSLADDLMHEGDIADRPGQMARLYNTAGNLRGIAIHLRGKS